MRRCGFSQRRRRCSLRSYCSLCERSDFAGRRTLPREQKITSTALRIAKIAMSDSAERKVRFFGTWRSVTRTNRIFGCVVIAVSLTVWLTTDISDSAWIPAAVALLNLFVTPLFSTSSAGRTTERATTEPAQIPAVGIAGGDVGRNRLQDGNPERSCRGA